jgi:hypothetical protein
VALHGLLYEKNQGSPLNLKKTKRFSKIHPYMYTISVVQCLKHLSFLKMTLMLFRINLTFWDELAHIAFQHVEKGQQIYISGRLVADTVESEDGKQQTYYKVKRKK